MSQPVTTQITPHQQRSEEEHCSPSTTCTLPTTVSSGPSARQTSPSGSSVHSSKRTPSTLSTSTSKVDPTNLPPNKRPVNHQRRKSRPNNLQSLPSPTWCPPYAETTTLESERQYLMQTLRKQGEYIERLLLRLCLAEQRLAEAKQQRSIESSSPPRTPTNGTHRRQTPREITKEIASLKSKISHSEEQERSTLPRLSELYVEIQKRERWDRVQRHLASTVDFQAQYQYHYYYQQQQQILSPSHPSAPPPSAVHGTFSHVSRPVEQFARMPDVQESPMKAVFSPGFSSCLSPLSPDFVPDGYGSLVADPFAESFRMTSGVAGQDEELLVGEDKGPEAEEDTEQEDREHRPLTPTNSSARSSSLPRSAVEMPFRLRRASVPTKFSWSDEDFEEVGLEGGPTEGA